MNSSQIIGPDWDRNLGQIEPSGDVPTRRAIKPIEDAASARLPCTGQEQPIGPARLVITRGRDEGAHFPIGAVRTTIGRHRDSDIVLDDVTVSRQHAVITLDGDRYTLRDTGSLNGTYLNRRPVQHAVLAHGDEIRIGTFRLTVYLAASPSSQAAECAHSR